MVTLASGMSYCDLYFQGWRRAVASAVLHSPAGVAIVDPGPTSSLATLKKHLADMGITIADVSALLLTHIHLDHAGATGTLVRENPRLRVYVHEIGAPHMADPARLIASATRLYGDAMDRMFGEFAPVPRDALVALKGGERIEAAGRALNVAYTPGHASHHVSYFSQDTGVAFVGDTAGIRVVPGGFVLPPTPPPDIDLGRWRESVGVIDAWRPDTLMLTHFGHVSPSAPHLTELRDHLDLVERLSKESLDLAEDDEFRQQWYADALRRELRRHLEESDAAAYEVSGAFDLNWRGLARYWRKTRAAIS